MSRKAEFRQRSRSGSVAIYGATTRHAMTSEPPSHEVRDTRATKNSHRPVAFMTLIFEQFDDISPVAAQSITLAPKKLIRTRRASEGSASEPSLARRVSMCKDAKLSCRGNINPSRCYRTHRGRPDATWAPSGRAKPERTKDGERPHSCLPGARSWVTSTAPLDVNRVSRVA
jgi:hypothetical protein